MNSCEKWKEGRIVLAALLLLAAVYTVIAADFASLGAFWSADCGARFAMIRNWIEHGSLIHLYYPARAVDPTGRIHALAYFLFHQPHGYTAIYTPLFPFLSGIAYRLFGFSGLSVIPVLSGIGTAGLLYACARRLQMRSRVLLPLIAGLGTPLLVFSVVFWDHVVMMFLTALAAYGMLRSLQENRMRFAAFAGASLGLGLWIHELMLALSIAVLLAALPLAWTRAGRRLILGLVAGLLPFALLWVGANVLLYGNIAGPHMASNMGANPHNHTYSIPSLLNEPAFLDRAQSGLTGSSAYLLILNSHQYLLPLFLVFAYVLTAYWAITYLFGTAWRFAPILSLIAAGLAAYLTFQIHWAYGLFLATPLLIPALAVPWDAARKRRKQWENGGQAIAPESLFYAWISRACWLFALIVFVNPMVPMVGWGNRFLLTALPFLVLLAVHALEEQFLSSGPRWRGVVASYAVALVGLSIFCQAEGLAMVRRNILYNRDLNQRISAIASPVLVFDDVGTASELAAMHPSQAQFLVQGAGDVALFTSALRYLNATEFTFVGHNGDAPLLRGLHLSQDQYFVEAESRPFIRKQPEEDGPDLAIVRFVLRTRPPAAPATKTARRGGPLPPAGRGPDGSIRSPGTAPGSRLEFHAPPEGPS